jgi:hypothetical protein
VEDDGVGFNEKNYRSFDESDSLQKAALGAKGVGRFLWLKAFDQVRVTSCFQQNGKMIERSFDFSEKNDGIFNPKEIETQKRENLTRVELRGLHEQYNNTHLPKKAKTIAERIIDHCLFFFLRPDCPTMLLEDEDENTPLNLNELFKEQAQVGEKTPLTVKKCELTVQAVRLYAGDRDDHLIHLCADDREVESIPIVNYIPSLNRKLKDSEGKYFVYAAYVSGKFLDDSVNEERTRIDFPKPDETLLTDAPPEEELVRAVLGQFTNQHEAEIESLRQEAVKKVEDYVQKKRPEFRYMLDQASKFIDRFPSHVSDRTYYKILTEIQAEEDTRLRETGAIIAEEAGAKKDDSAFEEKMQSYMNQLEDLLKTRLAQYVVHRKVVLELLEHRLFLQDDGKHAPEKLMHEIIFPMRKTSDQMAWRQQNLWVFDERLCYHEYLASDKQLRQITGNPQDEERTDIVVFGAANVFGEDPLGQLHFATIIEFKRPEREKFSFGGDDDPIEQVRGYVDKIRSHKALTVRGRTIEVNPALPIACYLICDLPAIEKLATDTYDFKVMPQGGGFFKYHEKLNYFVEIIAWQKLLKDAKNRNRILFQKLGLPE